MKHKLTLILVMVVGTATAQLKGHRLSGDFNRSLRIPHAVADRQWVRNTPMLNTFYGDQPSNAFTYWQGMTYTRYSVNGRFKSTYLFDVQGTLRESRASYSLKKSGILSYWRVQFSPQRTRSLLTYTIH
jgi:hypothetical protein